MTNVRMTLGPADITYRRLESIDDYRACVALQKETWGYNFADTVPLSILKVGQLIGGVTAGAFDPAGRMIGFVFGLTGVEGGRIVHWSDMLAVRPEVRDLGIGRQLKLYQRELLLPLGVEVVYWTYDPLEAKNAHFNLNKLGAEVHEYVINMYGEDTSSVLHAGLGTDRFVVAWRIASERVGRVLNALFAFDVATFEDAPIVNTTMGSSGKTIPVDGKLIAAPRVRVEVPENIQRAKLETPDAGARWRANTRRVFTHYLNKDYRVVTIYRDEQGRCFYILEKS